MIMNILFCGDKNIAHGVIIATLSLIENVREPLNIYILTASIKTKEREVFALDRDFSEFLDALVKQYDPQSFVRLYDITGEFNAQPPVANLATRFTPCCMLRLYADLIDDLPDRILYLDNDIICRGDISDLYNADMRDFELTGVLDYYGSHFFRQRFYKRDYLNSGVLLMNLSLIRKSGLFTRCREMCASKQMFMPDQSALNKLCKRKKFVPRDYNEQRKLKDTTKIQHFTTSFRFFPYFHKVSVKPWNITGMHEVLKINEYDALLERAGKLYNDFSQRKKETSAI